MKGTFHKSCSCFHCKRGRGRSWGKDIIKRNERKLRRTSKIALGNVIKGACDAIIAPISSPYTD